MELVPKKEFFVQWRVNNGNITIRTSDYLNDAPDAVLKGIAKSVCNKIAGKDTPLPQSFFDFVRTDEFIEKNRPLYVERSRNLQFSEQGESCNIRDSIDRLLDSGLITDGDIHNAYFSWTNKMNKQRMGFCSTMFRVVGISSVLDSADVPDFVRDYVVYHEILHLRQTFRIPHNAHDKQFREWEHMFPRWQEAEEYLPKFYFGKPIMCT